MSERSVEMQAPIPVLPKRDRRLLLAALAGPLAWLAQFGVGYGLVGPMCVARTRWWLHAVTVAALALTAVGAAHCARARRRPGGTRGAASRRALAAAGVALSLGFALLVVGTDVPGWLLDPCE
jgi:hypothetical protein